MLLGDGKILKKENARLSLIPVQLASKRKETHALSA